MLEAFKLFGLFTMMRYNGLRDNGEKLWMREIKSSFEIAMERASRLGEATDDERLRWKYLPEGEKLALRYLRGEASLVGELSRYEKKAKGYVIKGAEEIFLGNINLPRADDTKRTNKIAMEGLKVIKNDKVDVENVFSRIRHVFNHYVEQGEQQKKQAYESLKAEFGNRMKQAAQEQLGTVTGINIDVENHPQFQEEWRRTQARLNLQYITHLDECKKELADIE